MNPGNLESNEAINEFQSSTNLLSRHEDLIKNFLIILWAHLSIMSYFICYHTILLSPYFYHQILLVLPRDPFPLILLLNASQLNQPSQACYFVTLWRDAEPDHDFEACRFRLLKRAAR